MAMTRRSKPKMDFFMGIIASSIYIRHEDELISSSSPESPSLESKKRIIWIEVDIRDMSSNGSSLWRLEKYRTVLIITQHRWFSSGAEV
jgi:hypothetical protein